MNQPVCILQDIQNNTLQASHAMPLKDSTSDGTSTFAMGRMAFMNWPAPSPVQNPQKILLGNRDSSGVTESRRNRAIGKGTLTQSSPLSFTSHTNPSVVIDALARVRGGGAVAPAKKGANRSNGVTPSFAPVAQKNVYGNKSPYLFH